MQAPIELKFYNDDDSVKETYTVPRVRTKLLKASIRLGREIGEVETMAEDQINSLLDFIVDLFGNQFTRDELEDATDLFECFAVLGSVFGRANSLAAQSAKSNPTVPSLKKK